MNFNQVTLAGHIVRDPELSYTSNQVAIANFDIAVNYKRGETDETSFIKCSAFGKCGENIVKFFTKGKAILVTGRLQQNRWTAEDGTKRSRLQVVANSFQFVGGKDTTNAESNIEPNSEADKKRNDW